MNRKAYEEMSEADRAESVDGVQLSDFDLWELKLIFRALSESPGYLKITRSDESATAKGAYHIEYECWDSARYREEGSGETLSEALDDLNDDY